MTLLELLAEGSIAAAELIALLFVSPAAAQAHAVTDAQAMQHLDALRAAHRACATGRLPMRDCDEEPPAGHVRLSEDERIADAWLLAPIEAATPRATPMDEDTGHFLLLVPRRAASRATVVLRPASGDSSTLRLGAIDTGHAILVPLGGRALADGLAAGAVELELSAERETWWSTLVVQRAGQPALAVRGDE